MEKMKSKKMKSDMGKKNNEMMMKKSEMRKEMKKKDMSHMMQSVYRNHE